MSRRSPRAAVAKASLPSNIAVDIEFDYAIAGGIRNRARHRVVVNEFFIKYEYFRNKS